MAKRIDWRERYYALKRKYDLLLKQNKRLTKLGIKWRMKPPSTTEEMKRKDAME